VDRDELELLRLEYVLPPATRAANGERMLRAAVRRVASAVVPGGCPVVHLRQVQIAHGVAYALLAVPPTLARCWLRGSGCDNLYIRPFWTPSTGATIARDQFTLLWLKGRLEKGPALWLVLRNVPGFFGLLADKNDVALRVSAEADRDVIQTHVENLLTEGKEKVPVKVAEPGVRWWRLGPLTEAELWQAKAIIPMFGLELARDELREAKLGPFRSAVYFPGRGDPERLTLDDGSWTCSDARLTPADPPPRRQPPRGAALTPQSRWGGPRPLAPSGSRTQHPPPGPAPVAGPAFPAPASLTAPSVWFPGLPPPQSTSLLSRPAARPAPAASQPPEARSPRGRRRGQGRASAPAGAVAPSPGAPVTDSALTMLVTQLAAMTAQLDALQWEMRELRHENAALRAQVEAARGLQQHQPYAFTGPPPPPPQTMPFTPERTSHTSRPRPDSAETPPAAPLDACGDALMHSPPTATEPKRPRRLVPEQQPPPTTSPSASSSCPAPGSLAAVLLNDQ
jgi:hypothetical protein